MKDLAGAVWYERAATAGNAIAMTNLGALYENGWGVPKDYTHARQWYEKAAAGGYEIAKQNLRNIDRRK